MALLMEAKEKQLDRWDALRNVLIGHNPQKYLPQFFPEMVQEEVTEQDVDLDDTSGVWKFEEQVAPEDAEAILSQMLADPTGVLTGREAMNEGGWT